MQSCSQTKDHGYCSGNENSADAKLCFNYVTTKNTALGNAGMASFYDLSIQFSVLVSCHVI